MEFANQGTAILNRLNSKASRKMITTDLRSAARRKLDLLNISGSLDDLASSPGNQLKALVGDRQGQYSIRINQKFRVCFSWSDDGPSGVEIVDYQQSNREMMRTLRVPTHGPPTSAGEMLNEDFLKPLNITQTALAKRVGMTFHRLNEIVNGKRGISIDTALRFSKALGTSPDFWLNLQRVTDLYNAANSPEIADINAIQPLPRTQDQAYA